MIEVTQIIHGETLPSHLTQKVLKQNFFVSKFTSVSSYCSVYFSAYKCVLCVLVVITTNSEFFVSSLPLFISFTLRLSFYCIISQNNPKRASAQNVSAVVWLL